MLFESIGSFKRNVNDHKKNTSDNILIINIKCDVIWPMNR